MILYRENDEKDYGFAIIIIVVTCGNIFFPLLITVFIYAFLENFITISKKTVAYLVGVSIMLFISVLGFLFMTASGAVSYKIDDLKDGFNSGYKGFYQLY